MINKGRPNESGVAITPSFEQKYDCAYSYRGRRELKMHRCYQVPPDVCVIAR